MKVIAPLKCVVAVMMLSGCMPMQKGNAESIPPTVRVLSPDFFSGRLSVLKDRSPSEVSQILGQPISDDTSGRMRIIDYRGHDCTFSVFFGRNSEDVWRSNAIIQVNADGTTADAEPCVISALDKRK